MRVFLSYRREDSSAWTGRLRDGLVMRLGEDSVFQDVVTIRPGQSFTTAIETAMAQCDATIAVIGPRWLEVTDATGERRLIQPDDSVRQELGIALAGEKLVVPVLVGGAIMPAVDRLPPDLRELAMRQAVALRDESWHDDVERLVRALRGERAGRRSRRWLVVAGGVALAAAAGAVVVSLVADDDGGSDGATSSTVTDTTFNYYTAELRPCATPQPPDWTDLGVGGTTGEDPDPSWRFEVLGGGYRRAESERWEVILRMRAVNQAVGFMYHYPFYKLVTDGDAFVPDCFGLVGGGERMVSPGGDNEVLVGFTVPDEPVGALSVDVESTGGAYRVDLTSTTTG